MTADFDFSPYDLAQYVRLGPVEYCTQDKIMFRHVLHMIPIRPCSYHHCFKKRITQKLICRCTSVIAFVRAGCTYLEHCDPEEFE